MLLSETCATYPYQRRGSTIDWFCWRHPPPKVCYGSTSCIHCNTFLSCPIQIKLCTYFAKNKATTYLHCPVRAWILIPIRDYIEPCIVTSHKIEQVVGLFLSPLLVFVGQVASYYVADPTYLLANAYTLPANMYNCSVVRYRRRICTLSVEIVNECRTDKQARTHELPGQCWPSPNVTVSENRYAQNS